MSDPLVVETGLVVVARHLVTINRVNLKVVIS